MIPMVHGIDLQSDVINGLPNFGGQLMFKFLHNFSQGIRGGAL